MCWVWCGILSSKKFEYPTLSLLRYLQAEEKLLEEKKVMQKEVKKLERENDKLAEELAFALKVSMISLPLSPDWKFSSLLRIIIIIESNCDFP